MAWNTRQSNVVLSIAKILEKEGFISKVSVSQEKNKKVLKIELKYNKNVPSISDVKLISKPSVHYYVNKNRITRAIQKNAIGIVSTNKGVMTTREAKKQGVGGELICQIY